MDVLFVVSDTSKIGIETAERIRELAKAMELKIGKNVLVINRAFDEMKGIFPHNSGKNGFDNVYRISDDNKVNIYNVQGKNLLSLPNDSKAANEVAALINEIMEEKINE